MTPVQIKNQIIDVLVDGETPKEWCSYSFNVVNNLAGIKDEAFLHCVHDLAMFADSIEDTGVRRRNIVFLINELENDFKNGILTIHQNLDMIPAMNHWDHVKITVNDLRVGNREGLRVPHLEAHLAARDAYPIPNNYSPNATTVIYGRSEACKVVEENPERIDDIIELITRGTSPDDIRAALTAMDFGKSSSLRNGAL